MEKIKDFFRSIFFKELTREEEQEVVKKIYEKIRNSK